MAGQKSENFRHAGLVRRLGQFRREQFKLGMARRRKLDPELAAFQSRRHGHANLGVKLQLLNFRANRIFGLSQPGNRRRRICSLIRLSRSARPRRGSVALSSIALLVKIA